MRRRRRETVTEREKLGIREHLARQQLLDIVRLKDDGV